MKMSETTKEIMTALSKAQSQMENAVKDSSNPFFKSKYADLTSVRSACIPELNKCGISVVQPVYSKDDAHYVETYFLHITGEWLSSGEMKLVLSKTDMQALGSAITYARRYQLQSMACLSAEDDDGNAASGNHAPTQSTTFVPPANSMQQLITTAKVNGWNEADLKQYIEKLGYQLKGNTFPLLNATDYKDVLKHFSVKKT